MARLRAEERREQLLDAAVQVAASRDLEAVSVQEIAAAAGVADGLLYHYFPTKQALLTAVVRRAADRMIAAYDAVPDGPPMESLGAGLYAYLDHVQADAVGWKVLLQARSGEPAVIAAEVEARSRHLMLSRLGIDAPSPALELLIQGILGLERDVCRSWLDHPGTPREVVGDVLENAFVAMLQTVAAHDPVTAAAMARLLG